MYKKKSKIHGYGIFADKNIKRGSIFYKISTTDVVNRPRFRYAKIGKDKYINDVFLNYINHSCEPNTELIIKKDRIFLKALKNIKIDEEIVCDYNKTETGGKKVQCNCGSKNCKKYFRKVE